MDCEQDEGNHAGAHSTRPACKFWEKATIPAGRCEADVVQRPHRDPHWRSGADPQNDLGTALLGPRIDRAARGPGRQHTSARIPSGHILAEPIGLRRGRVQNALRAVAIRWGGMTPACPSRTPGHRRRHMAAPLDASQGIFSAPPSTVEAASTISLASSGAPPRDWLGPLEGPVEAETVSAVSFGPEGPMERVFVSHARRCGPLNVLMNGI